MKMIGAFHVLVAGIAIGVTWLPPVQASTLLFDGTFNPSDWTATSAFGPTITQQTSGGNPGDFRLITVGVGQNVPTVVNLGTNLTYDPSGQGAITTLNYSVDLETINGAGGTYIMLLAQNGVDFVDSVSRFATANTWANFSESGRVASDFGRLDGLSGTPDFSAGGAPITFGYFASFGGGGFFTATMGVDNYALTVNSVAGVSTPEPSSFSLLGVGGLLLLAGCLRRRNGVALIS